MLNEITPMQAALLTLHLIAAYDQEKGRSSTRLRVSARTLRRIALRPVLRDAFVDEWVLSLARLGWGAFQVGDHFALVQLKTVEGWTRVAPKRIDDTLQRVRDGDTSVFDAIAAEVAHVPDASDDD